MGLYFGMRGSIKKNGANYEELKVSKFDPNPAKFNILKHYYDSGNLAIWINYPNCTNYEGNKIIVFKNTTWEQLNKLKEIDPHFTESDEIKPFARFEPTDYSWELTKRILKQF